MPPTLGLGTSTGSTVLVLVLAGTSSSVWSRSYKSRFRQESSEVGTPTRNSKTQQ
jgi:hypothetical protein